MRATAAAIAVAGVLTLSGLIVLGGRVAMPPEPVKSTRPVALTPSAAAPAVHADQPEPLDEAGPSAVGTKARPVAPDVVAPLAPGEGGLVRLEPRQPLSEPVGPLKRPPGPTLLHRPVAPAAGRIEVDGLTILPAGVVPLAPEETCIGAGGESWPCGMMARTAFRAWLRGRAISCHLPEGLAQGTATELSLPCTVGAQDIGAWLVANGWAKAEAGQYADEAKRATDERRGLHGPGPASPAG